jgi:hypothetical protein
MTVLERPFEFEVRERRKLRRTPDAGQQGMMRKSGSRRSEKIMLKQRDEIVMRFSLIGS